MKPRKTGVLRQWLRLSAGVSRAVFADPAGYNQPNFRRLGLQAVFAFLVAIALGHSGPYGTFTAMDLIPRLGFWIVAIMGPWAVWQVLFHFTRSRLSEDVPWLVLTAGLMAPFVLIGSGIMLAFTLMIFEGHLDGFLAAWPAGIATWSLFSFGLLLPLQWIGTELARDLRRSGGARVADFLMHKLPATLRSGELIAIKSEDHYLRVFTTKGDGLIHMSLSDALIALDGYPGVQTHRSWWVSLDNPEKLNPADNWETIAAFEKVDVPVSRRRKASVKGQIFSIEE